MDKKSIIRAWRDPAYRASLSEEERAALPECPSGRPLTELSDEDLGGVAGGEVITAPYTIPLYACGPSVRYYCPPRSLVLDLCPPRSYRYLCPLPL